MKKLIPVFLILFISTLAFAQDKSRIVGTVTTAEGAAIVGVKVTITSDMLIANTMSAETNERGYVRFVLLPVGIYDIKFEKEGYKTIDQKGIQLGYDATATIDKVLEPSEFEEVVTITGEAPIVDETSSGIGDKLDVDILANTPNTRLLWHEMPKLVAGFNDVSSLGSVQVGSHAWNTDGVNTSDPRYGNPSSAMSHEAIQQLDITQFGANAEYGSFTGASMNVVTKSGGNAFHGEVNYFMQRINWVSDNTKNVEGVSLPDASNLYDPNFVIGGPLLKDKIWFFFNYNYSKDSRQVELADAKVINAVWNYNTYFFKFNSRWDDRNMTHVSYYWNSAKSPNRSSGNYIEELEGTLFLSEAYNKTLILQHSFVANENWILEGRFAGFRIPFDMTPVGGEDTPAMFDIILNKYLPGSSSNTTTRENRDRDQFLLTTNYYNDDLYGSHSIKFGFEYESSLGYEYFKSRDLQLWWAGSPYMKYDRGEYDGGVRINRWAGFAQDSWSINDRLTLNYGFRYDSTGYTADDQSKAVIKGTFVKYNDPAFRLGFAYDLFGDGKTVLRGFFGRYFEGAVEGNTGAAARNQPPWLIYLWAGDQWLLFDAQGGSSDFHFDPDLSNQYTEGFMFGVDRELMENMSGSATLVYKYDKNFIGQIYPDTTWVESTTDFSNDNGSYSGKYYGWVRTGTKTVLTNPTTDDVGVLDTPYRRNLSLLFQLNKRMSDNWSMKASYTYSRFTGNVGQSWGSMLGFLTLSNPNAWINSRGHNYLERPHTIKLSGTYIAPFDILISPFIMWMNGLPYVPIIRPDPTAVVRTQANDGTMRLPNQFNIDIRLEKAFTFGEKYRFGILLDVFNLMNSDTVTAYRSGQLDSPNFEVPSEIVPPRFFQLGLRFTF